MTSVRLFIGATLAAAAMTLAGVAKAQERPVPNPILALKGTEPYSAGGKNWVRYRFEVANRSAYPTAMFAAAPALPPCGTNTNASRSWIDFYDMRGKRLYGFCAIVDPLDLDKIWFAVEEGQLPPSWVYIEIHDRQADRKYKSNLAETTP